MITLSDLHVEEGERLPWGHAVAWYDFSSKYAVCLPVGIHFIAAKIREGYIRIRCLNTTDPITEAYFQGHQDGFRSGVENVTRYTVKKMIQHNFPT